MDNNDEIGLRFSNIGLVEVQDGKRSESSESAVEWKWKPGSLCVEKWEKWKARQEWSKGESDRLISQKWTC